MQAANYHHPKYISTPLRREISVKMQQQLFDLLIIGGGITGAGIALDAASRGLKVALVDKQDFASGTSSRSTKLVHGGLRYLAQFEFKLVRDVAKERKILFCNAPQLVIPEKMLLPFIEHGTYSKWMAAIGLWIYDLIGDVKKEERKVIMNAEEAKMQEPLLDEKQLLGGGLYTEYRTDDARLTMEVLKTSVEKYDACCLNYAEVTKFLYSNNGKINGAAVKDALSQDNFEIKAKKIINATGPWVDLVRGMDGEVTGKTLHHTKGVHIVVPYNRFPLKESVYFDALEKRMIFAIPRDEVTYIGTTDTNFSAKLEEPKVTLEDVMYLLNSVNKIFPTIKLEKEDVVSSWAGIRPLIHEEGKAPSEISRKDEVFVSSTGLISIAGGKLTGYRTMAEKVTDMVMHDFAEEKYKEFLPCVTHNIRVCGGEFNEPGEWYRYFDEIVRKTPDAEKKDVIKLLHHYGSNTDKILKFAEQLEGEHKRLRAEIWYVINYEGVTSISDFLVRRTGMLYFERPETEKILPAVTTAFAEFLNPAEEVLTNQRSEFLQAYKNALSFK